ncbi:amino acid ABC transporter permease [Paraburkholderia sp. EG285A]|uniref:amino acid ABC transporter permease n=1 Tax=Paraburkholderia sp. EG285A TaxID=3237009 RepID=UPI0034D1A174
MSSAFALLILESVRWTLALSLVAFLGGLPGGLLIAIGRSSTATWLRSITASYIELFQGTPLLLQIFVVYYGMALFGFDLGKWVAVSLALTFHASAYLGEIWRGCIAALPRGQMEGGISLGLGYVKTMRLIVLPQALKMSIPATVGFLVQLIKGTSLASLIGFMELTRTGQVVANATYEPMTTYAVVGLLYFLICWPLSLFASRIEERLAVSQR